MLDEMNSTPNKIIQENISCTNCAAVLKFQPGSMETLCEYCGTRNEIIAKDTGQIEELDYYTFVRRLQDKKEVAQQKVIKCHSCGGQTIFENHVVGDSCPFCGTSLIVENATACEIISPSALLPFMITKDDAFKKYRGWIGGLWFAPNKLKKLARVDNRLIGLYIPYWTYDCQTVSVYTGMRGDNYTEYVNRYVKDENGNTRMVRQPVVKVRWHPVSGRVPIFFDDVLIVASTTLPKEQLDALAPFDLQELVKFAEQYLSGFKTESYQIDLPSGFKEAKIKIDTTIVRAVRQDIGGDHQRIQSLHTDYDDITFKHILLPIWISSYEYNRKIYRFLINGRTGSVQGERPYSKIKIAFAVILVLLLILLIVFISQEQGY